MKAYDTFSPTIPEPEKLYERKDLPSADNVFTQNEKKNTNNVREKKTQKKEKAKEKIDFVERIRYFFTHENLRWIFGLFLGALAIYIGISFISFFASSIHDQSEIYNSAIGQSASITNKGGEGGARLSEFLINECFGLGSFVIVIWLSAMSLKLLIGKPRFKSINFTIKCLVALITVSLIIGLFTIGLNSHLNWGGFHGHYVNEFVIHFLGWTGAIILCLFMVGCFVVICMRDVIKWIKKKHAQYKERKRIEAEKRAIILERERELEEMRRFEDVVDGGINPPDEKKEEPSDVDPMVFEKQECGLYNDLPDFEEIEYSLEEENLIDDHKTIEESMSSVKENVEEIYEEHSVIEDSVEFESYDYNKEDSGLISDNKTESSDNGVENEDDSEIAPLEINVNEISETNAKRTVIVPLMPGTFPYKFPPYDLLSEGKGRIPIDLDEQQENKDRIEKTLLDFKIPITSIRSTIGPTVTLYEIVPDKGVKVASIKRLVDDIALSLSAEGVRIIAPIPGKGTVGIEVANKRPQMVSMRTIIKSKAFQENDFKLPVAIGSTISNEVYITDLAKMPHLLVAGATGQGKSVGLNAIIASLLFSKRPDELKFVMIDPKMVEFSLYEKIESHYLAKIPGEDEAIITNMEKAISTLNSLVIEMENRYKLLKDIHTKNIIEYNNKIKDGLANPVDGHRFLPYIVVVVDEFADLIMNVGKEVEMPIARLAQKARAVGIHVIIATQRPSADVITGMIKGNFPARMAFKVASGIDSKTILDTTGAQYLIGKGDMLILNSSPLTRVQCAFIDTPEVEAICEYIYKQPYGQGAYILPEPVVESSSNDDKVSGSFNDWDPLLEECARMVVSSNKASTSNLQRHFSLGYNRAGKIMDQMESLGIVGPSQGSKPRSVLIDLMSLEDILRSVSNK